MAFVGGVLGPLAAATAPASLAAAGGGGKGAGSILTGLDLIRNGQRPKGWALRRDPFHLETSVPGIFAAGDVRFGSQARVGAAVGSGGMAVGLIREYLKTV